MSQNSSIYMCLFRFISYLTLYVFGTIILMLYILSESLPTDNILPIDDNIQRYLSFAISPVIAVNNSIITPQFISSFFEITKLSTKHRNKLIMILRTFTTIIIPILFSMLLLNDCGALWVKMWRPCIRNKNDETSPFNIDYCRTTKQEAAFSSNHDIMHLDP
eukprot:91787_1